MKIVNAFTTDNVGADEDYNGFSEVVINTDLGYFSGKAWCHPDEKFSHFKGCRIAEMRAIIKYYKAKRKNLKIELKAYNDIYTAISPTDFRSLKLIGKWIKRRKKDIEEIEQKIIELENAIKIESEREVGAFIKAFKLRQEEKKLKREQEIKALFKIANSVGEDKKD